MFNEDKCFKVNEYLELRLEDGETNLYINDVFFVICKKLLFNIPQGNDDFNNVKSIDDVVGIHERDHNQNEMNTNQYLITPEEEFKGHCSNLQAWYEHHYDTQILHRNLAFQLLRRLTQVGDQLAKRVYKEEIILRIRSGESKVIIYLIEEGFFDDFSEQELESLMEDHKVGKSLLKILNDQKHNFKEILFNFLITKKIGINFLFCNLSNYISNLSFSNLRYLINSRSIEIIHFMNDPILSFLIREFKNLKNSDSVVTSKWNELFKFFKILYYPLLDVEKRYVNFSEFYYLIKKYYNGRQIDVEFKVNKWGALIFKVKPINKFYYHQIELYTLNISHEKIQLLNDIKNAIFNDEDVILREIKCNEYIDEYEENYKNYENYEKTVKINTLILNPKLSELDIQKFEDHIELLLQTNIDIICKFSIFYKIVLKKFLLLKRGEEVKVVKLDVFLFKLVEYYKKRNYEVVLDLDYNIETFKVRKKDQGYYHEISVLELKKIFFPKPDLEIRSVRCINRKILFTVQNK